mmetsp:Transcript_37182/g.86697  ORF Transcript_37182/g.86697 Transcript_37182/m.86697 type:complete len:173 (+) Transcript_37182:1344-1862(+)
MEIIWEALAKKTFVRSSPLNISLRIVLWTVHVLRNVSLPVPLTAIAMKYGAFQTLVGTLRNRNAGAITTQKNPVYISIVVRLIMYVIMGAGIWTRASVIIINENHVKDISLLYVATGTTIAVYVGEGRLRVIVITTQENPVFCAACLFVRIRYMNVILAQVTTMMEWVIGHR